MMDRDEIIHAFAEKGASPKAMDVLRKELEAKDLSRGLRYVILTETGVWFSNDAEVWQKLPDALIVDQAPH